jgi:hypothetical protein
MKRDLTTSAMAARTIYIAKRFGDAVRLNPSAAAGVDYGVEADNYRGGVVFGASGGRVLLRPPETAAVACQVM